MQRLVLCSRWLVLLAALGVVLVGCDSSPSSVEDFEIQPDLRVTTGSSVTFFNGQSPSPTMRVQYQGLTSLPEAEGTGALSVEVVEENGSPENGNRRWRLSYTGTISGDFVEESVAVRASTADGEVVDSVSVRVNNPVSSTADFAPSLAVVADYEDEQRSTVADGGVAIDTTREDVSPNSNGLAALRVTSGGSGSVTINRQASLPGSEVFTFLLKPDPSTDFTLTLGFTEDTGGSTATREVDVPVPSGSEWRKYTIAVGQLFADFDPVATRAGGNGLLQSVSLSTDQSATFVVDELFFGTTDAPQVEIADFESTTLAYGSFSAIEFANVGTVGPQADGPTGRSMSWTQGGNFFGYNYERLRVDASAADVVSVRLGEVSKAFNLYVFVETVDDGGRVGGYSFDNGNEVPIEAGADFRTIEVPLTQLGNDPSALFDPGIVNVGFEIRRPSSDDTTDPIEVIVDDIKLKASD